MNFTEFVIKNHPDPDSLVGDSLTKWTQIQKLAQQYADEEKKKLLEWISEDVSKTVARGQFRYKGNVYNVDELLTRYHESQKI